MLCHLAWARSWVYALPPLPVLFGETVLFRETLLCHLTAACDWIAYAGLCMVRSIGITDISIAPTRLTLEPLATTGHLRFCPFLQTVIYWELKFKEEKKKRQQYQTITSKGPTSSVKEALFVTINPLQEIFFDCGRNGLSPCYAFLLLLLQSQPPCKAGSLGSLEETETRSTRAVSAIHNYYI